MENKDHKNSEEKGIHEVDWSNKQAMETYTLKNHSDYSENRL